MSGHISRGLGQQNENLGHVRTFCLSKCCPHKISTVELPESPFLQLQDKVDVELKSKMVVSHEKITQEDRPCVSLLCSHSYFHLCLEDPHLFLPQNEVVSSALNISTWEQIPHRITGLPPSGRESCRLLPTLTGCTSCLSYRLYTHILSVFSLCGGKTFHCSCFIVLSLTR